MSMDSILGCFSTHHEQRQDWEHFSPQHKQGQEQGRDFFLLFFFSLKGHLLQMPQGMQSVQPPRSLTFDITMHDDVLVQEGKALQDLSCVLAPHCFCQWSVLLQLIQYRTLSNVHKEWSPEMRCCCSHFLLQRWNKATYIITVLTYIITVLRFLTIIIITCIYKASFLTAAHSSSQSLTMFTVTKYTSAKDALSQANTTYSSHVHLCAHTHTCTHTLVFSSTLHFDQ